MDWPSLVVAVGTCNRVWPHSLMLTLDESCFAKKCLEGYVSFLNYLPTNDLMKCGTEAQSYFLLMTQLYGTIHNFPWGQVEARLSWIYLWLSSFSYVFYFPHSFKSFTFKAHIQWIHCRRISSQDLLLGDLG